MPTSELRPAIGLIESTGHMGTRVWTEGSIRDKGRFPEGPADQLIGSKHHKTHPLDGVIPHRKGLDEKHVKVKRLLRIW